MAEAALAAVTHAGTRDHNQANCVGIECMQTNAVVGECRMSGANDGFMRDPASNSRLMHVLSPEQKDLAAGRQVFDAQQFK